ncbi:MAG: porin family protein [Hyphomicrobiaceae bacterium]|nr:porin family protein [Hyphomicrobiaceae bacterium]
MRMMRKVLAACAGVALAASVAAAPAQAQRSWSGFYFGGSVGAAWGNVDYTRAFPGFPAFTENFGHDISDVIGGGHVGIQHQMGQFVIGAEASLSGIGMDSKVGYALQPPTFDRADVNWLLAVTGKIGFAFSPQWLFYVKGGYASADVTAHLFRPDNGVVERGGTKREHGWTVGAGLDYRLTQHVVLGVEYNYYTFDGDNRVAALSNGNPITTTNLDTDIHAVTARLTILFGRRAPAVEPLK